ncbi:hypothetical protein RIF25_09900 [Thermosynechococcaceae cyanobacterium BACA0444]|uniref:Bulb-type lectin domain-containing protein n=1 Tax=Pseudocalidococcus azoricus BACA0444 TaxID=2918990 RepID=A0AAE4JXJ4_9CYAN|nr:hypothetical protein [Pseudocalidococcus azoricus]MDS3861118.1 hypothetical protein [Pseudocalidococcus azoricus BACA0444]
MVQLDVLNSLKMLKVLSRQVFKLTTVGVGASLILAWGAMMVMAGAGSDRLNPGEVLRPGEYLASTNGVYFLRLQSDGNLVVYERRGGQEFPLWSSKTNNRAVERLVMQNDGNLVLYSPGQSPLWSSGTVGRRESFVVMQNDGNLVIYLPGDPIWSSRTRR